jgi:hypothetical protein
MYTFSQRLKTSAFILIALGLVGIVYGFLSTPKTLEDVEKIVAAAHHEGHGGHGGHATAASHDTHAAPAHEAHAAKTEGHHEVTHITEEAHAVSSDTIHVAATDSIAQPLAPETAKKSLSVVPKKEKHIDPAVAHKEHIEHVMHQLQNKPWAALYVACIFFLLVTMGALAFYAIQQVAQAGWSPVLFRVMQGITAYLPVGSIIFFGLLLASGLHMNHLFTWMEDGVTKPGSPNYDALIAGKSGYLNFGFWKQSFDFVAKS